MMEYGYAVGKNRLSAVIDPILLQIYVRPSTEESLLDRHGLWVLRQRSLFPSLTFSFIFAINLNYSSNQEGKCY